jgi:hypothetical protein
MTADTIKELLNAAPFLPFRMRLSNGDAIDVRNPDSVALMKSKVFVADPRSEHWTFISYLHIAAIEALGGGDKRRGRRPGRGRPRG